MTSRFLILIAALGLLVACETSPKDADNAASSGSSSSSASSDSSSSAAEALTQELISVGNTVLFDYDSSALSDDAKATLSAQAAFLASNPSVTITVEGHCDERGTREYNLALGERRAAASRDYLVAQGVDVARIKTISYGKERPIFVGSDKFAYSKNRRAVSIIK